ncbi:MAG: outer membrane protein TolC [Planctomycetaceae bacterium]|jgi:outer membrane protein TolC
MSKLLKNVGICLCGAALFSGCAKVGDLQYLVGESRTTEDGTEELDYYLDQSTKIDYPSVYQSSPDEVTLSHEPRTIMDLNKDEIRDMSLEEVIRTALLNSTVIRAKASFNSPGNSILANPNGAPSIYDPSIQSTGVLFGSRGVESALASFDTSFATEMTWGRNESVQNNQAGNNLPGGSIFVGETGNFSSTLSKNFAYGGSLELGHEVNYLGSNSPSLFASSYSGHMRARYRHPLLAGSGTEFTRIAGPISASFGGLTGVTQGVSIARINQDISLTDFEANLTNLVKDVEDSYWELYLQYRIYDTNVSARNSALRTWRDSKRKLEIGGVRGFSVEDEAQARDQYFNTKATTQQNLSLLYKNESALRRLIGLSVNDGTIIRPSDEPLTARIDPDWASSVAEALTNRVELRRHKWNIKSLELQLLAATSLVRPRLDFVAGYSVNGFGDDLIAHNDSRKFNSFYDTLTDNEQTGWSTGFVMEMPIGLRSAKAQVQNIELRLAKARDVLSAQELEIAHEVGNAFQELAEKYMTAQTYFNRREAAKDRAELFEKKFRVGTQTLDLLLRAQSSLADAEVAYFRSLVAYSQAIANLHYRQGTLLPFNSVYMAEGEWDAEAYYDAYRRAKSRTYAFDASNRKRTEPAEFVEASFETSSGDDYFNAEPFPKSRPMTTESALPPPAEDDQPSADDSPTTEPAPSGSAAFNNDGLNGLRSIPEPSPLNLLAPPSAPAKPRMVRPNTAKSIKPDRNSAQSSPSRSSSPSQPANKTELAARTPIRHTMSPAARTTLRSQPTAPSTVSTASTIDPVSASETSAPDSDGFFAPIRVSTSGVTRVRAK